MGSVGRLLRRRLNRRVGRSLEQNIEHAIWVYHKIMHHLVMFGFVVTDLIESTPNRLHTSLSWANAWVSVNDIELQITREFSHEG